MKVVQLNTVCDTGSTGTISASLYRLAESENIESYFAYGRNSAPTHFRAYRIGNKVDFILHVLINFFEGKSGFGSKYVTRKFLSWLDSVRPDVIHIHNLHGFYVNVSLLFSYIKQKQIKVIWTLHDCWSFTGQCAHFDYINCNKWISQCSNCPIYRTEYPYSIFKDNSYKNYLIKKETFCGVTDLTIVTPSKWLANLVKRSYLGEYTTIVIPNGIDLSTFCILDTLNETKFVSDKKIVLGVANVWTERKGLSYFIELANSLDNKYQVVLIGLSKRQCSYIRKSSRGKIMALTRTANRNELVEWCNRSYVYVNTTLEDNFPTTNLEALACGTPVITFATGGSPESITDSCGMVVDKGNLSQLIEAIHNMDSTGITAEKCRQQAENFNQNIQFQKYIDLYME